jgi:hypothetical protein
VDLSFGAVSIRQIVDWAFLPFDRGGNEHDRPISLLTSLFVLVF